ncbi:hypothetical protein [Brevundimonas sp.]|uniref:hypothetical protein n=1 Tax=Brevundimonas sp. TaxID=1871086 RepID=UPI00289A7458|nr:hypothetical protein [Brevundimonas sp.]
MKAAISPQLRALLEGFIQTGIDLLDEIDRAEADLEPDADAEVVSEDDGIVRVWWPMERTA